MKTLSYGNPATHLTRTETGWTLIHNGMPLCAETSSLADCLALASRAKLHVPAQVWIASLGRFGSMAEAKSGEAAKDTFSYLFTNIETGEAREVRLQLRSFFCRIDNATVFQMFLDGEPVAETAATPDAAIEAGAWIDQPRQWGWVDIKRELPNKAAFSN